MHLLTEEPEVCLYFNHTLHRGNRVSKVSSNAFNAFESPNFPPLVNGDFSQFHDCTANFENEVN